MAFIRQPKRLWLAGLPVLASVCYQHAVAQTAGVTSLTDQSCAGTRAARNLGCTANDFVVGLAFDQPSATAYPAVLLEVPSPSQSLLL